MYVVERRNTEGKVAQRATITSKDSFNLFSFLQRKFFLMTRVLVRELFLKVYIKNMLFVFIVLLNTFYS